MDRTTENRDNPHGSFPHTRGDGPAINLSLQHIHLFSPHPWGWTDPYQPPSVPPTVFPTPVGMDRLLDVHWPKFHGFPHTRGDGPEGTSEGWVSVVFSPHPWGWTCTSSVVCESIGVFPTPVGMDRLADVWNAVEPWFSPHPWGWTDASYAGKCRSSFSPHPWGWTGSVRAIQRASSFSPHPWGWTLS